MPDIQLVWPNKDLTLRALGEHSYTWVHPDDCQLRAPLQIESLTKGELKLGTNVLAIGDGLDVLEALQAATTVFEDGIRLVYIDPPFNTQVDFRQYRDTMEGAITNKEESDC